MESVGPCVGIYNMRSALVQVGGLTEKSSAERCVQMYGLYLDVRTVKPSERPMVSAVIATATTEMMITVRVEQVSVEIGGRQNVRKFSMAKARLDR